MREVNWQAGGPGMGGASEDPFSAVEAQVRAMVAAPWWHGAAPPQRTEAITAQMLSGAGEWWLFGAWGRWYRCGLDGHWHPCPPPADPAARRVVGPTPPGAGNPPVPSQLFPIGPDLVAGRVASTGFLGGPPETAVVARLQQALITALSVNPAQFALQDNAFPPGTPSTVAAAWGALLWCAGSPVVLAEHPLIELFVPYLTTPGRLLRWLIPPDLSRLTTYYAERLGAGDVVGASYLIRVMHEVASGLAGDPRFRPGADALAAITAATLPMVQHDMAAARFGPGAITQEWRRRCPAEYAIPMVRDGAPGEYLRLGLYDLAQTVAGLYGRALGPGDARRAGVAVLAADLQGAPHAVAAVLPWLDPDSARTLQSVLTQPDHPLRELWPRDGRLPEALRSDDAEEIQALLATSYTVALAWCRLAQIAPPAPGFAVPVAAATELASPALQAPKSTGELTPWQIIEAARAHLAAERSASSEEAAEAVSPAEPAPLLGPPAASPAPPAPAEPPAPPQGAVPPLPPPEPARAEPPTPYPPFPPQPPVPDPQLGYAAPGHALAPGLAGEAPVSPAAFGQQPPGPLYPPGPPAAPVPPSHLPPTAPQAQPPSSWPPPPSFPPAAPGQPPPPAPDESPGGPSAWSPDPSPDSYAEPSAQPSTGSPSAPGAPAEQGVPGPDAPIVEVYDTRFLCGPDDVERLLTEVRRRGKWAQRLRGQEVSTASAPALLLLGAPSSGQRRLARMVARALADVEVSSGDVHTLHAEDLRERGPEGVRAALDEHAGHTLLLERLDTLILDEPDGPAYAAALYRARVEGVSDTALVATCGTERMAELSAASPELVTEFRAVRLPDLSDPQMRAALLGLLAGERQVSLSAAAWEVAREDLALLRGRGRFTNARIIEVYLERACTNQLGRAGETRAIGGSGALVLTPADLRGIVEDLST
jgi:hypothetical protein